MKGPLNCTSSELSTYLRALAAGCLPISSLATNASAPSKSIHIASKSYQHGKKTVSFHGFQFSVTSNNSTDDHGKDWLRLLQVDFLAKISPHRVEALELREKEADYGKRCGAWFAKYNLDTCSWRTPQCWLVAEWEPSLETFPKWGTMRDGECFPLAPLVRHTCEKECSSWPTPNASDALVGGSAKLEAMRLKNQTRPSGAKIQRKIKDQFKYQFGKTPPAKFYEFLMGWPIGFTGLDPFPMDRFLRWLRSHGIASNENDSRKQPRIP